MSVNIVNKTTGDLTRVAGNATDKVGNLDALTTIDKTSIVGGVNEVNDKVKDVSNALANYASLDNSGAFPDANNVNKELVYINGFQSGLTNYPSEVSNTIGILLTRWFYYSGDLTVPRMQLVFTLNGLSFCRFFDGTSWLPWTSNGVGNLSDLTTTDKSSCVGAINEVASDLTDLKNDIVFGDLPTNGFNPLTQCNCIFFYSVYPDLIISQGVPNNYSEYGTVFGCSGIRYKLLVYTDVNGKFAVLSQGNEWVTYSS